MGFDTKKFLKTQYQPRTKEVPVPELKEFFGEKEDPVFLVRGLSGAEIGKCNETADNPERRAAMVEGMMSGSRKEMVDAVKEMVGATDDVAKDTAKRIYYLIAGCVEPEVDLDLAKRICKISVAVFTKVTNEIQVLSAMGYEPGKAKPSGRKTK